MKKLLVLPLLVTPWALSAHEADKDFDLGHWYIEGGYVASSLKDAQSTITFDSNANTCEDVIPQLLPGPLGCNAGSQSGVVLLFPSNQALGPGNAQTFETTYDDGSGYDVSLGYDFPGAFRLELNYADFDNDLEEVGGAQADDTLQSQLLMGNLWFDFNESGTVQPYLGLGLGAARLSLEEADDTVMVAQAGLGLNFALTDHVKINLGYRYFEGKDAEFSNSTTTYDTEYAGQRVSLGLRYDFLAEPPPPPDSDGDGVLDDKDQCPNTPRGVAVDPLGCPLDSDGDGVPDYQDKCPGTLPGTKVSADGCPLDSDGDGVIDAKDQCPRTEPGRKVLENGCESIVLEGVNFETNRSTLTPHAIQVCRSVADTLQRARDLEVELQGHTDSVGAAEYNQRLSQARAEAVRSCLIQNGVAASRLTARGYGEYQPVASNSSAEGRAKNRRTEMKITNN